LEDLRCTFSAYNCNPFSPLNTLPYTLAFPERTFLPLRTTLLLAFHAGCHLLFGISKERPRDDAAFGKTATVVPLQHVAKRRLTPPASVTCRHSRTGMPRLHLTTYIASEHEILVYRFDW